MKVHSKARHQDQANAMFGNSGAVPWMVTREDYEYLIQRGHDVEPRTIGDLVLDSSVGADARKIRPALAAQGKIWCLGYWYGLEEAGPEPSLTLAANGSMETQCFYWAACQELYELKGASMGNTPTSFLGGEVFPDNYQSQDITDRMTLIWHRTDNADPTQQNMATADVVILGKKDRGQWVLAHAIVEAASVKDPYIRGQIDYGTKVLRDQLQTSGEPRFPAQQDLAQMYASKSGCGGPVSLHPLDVYTTDLSYGIIGLYKYK